VGKTTKRIVNSPLVEEGLCLLLTLAFAVDVVFKIGVISVGE